MQLLLEIVASPADRQAATNETIAAFERRLDALVVTADVKSQGVPSDGRIVVDVWRVRDVDRLKKIISDNGNLELTHVISKASPAPFQTYATKEEAIASVDKSGTLPANRRVLLYFERAKIGGGSENAIPTKWLIVESPAIIDGNDLRTASPLPSRTGLEDEYQIVFTLNKTGAAKFGKWTAANIKEYMAVVLNDEIKSVTFIKTQIFDSGEIPGHCNKESAEDLSLVLKSGSLPFPVKIVGESFFQQK